MSYKKIDIYVIKYKDKEIEKINVYDDNFDEALSDWLSENEGMYILKLCEEIGISVLELINNVSLEKYDNHAF